MPNGVRVELRWTQVGGAEVFDFVEKRNFEETAGKHALVEADELRDQRRWSSSGSPDSVRLRALAADDLTLG
jgi:hypothetical protein